VNTGNNKVCLAVLACILASPHAGQESETGPGAVRVASELVAEALAVQHCAQQAGQRAELVFEMLEPDDMDTDLPRLLATGAREVVHFEWNQATGELSFSTTAASTVFSDLQYPGAAQAYAREPLNCR
jgi:hypothetical protein